MLRDRPFLRSLALAVAAHVCAVVFARAYVRQHASPRADAAPIEITIDERAEPPPPPAPPPEVAPLPTAGVVAPPTSRRLAPHAPPPENVEPPSAAPPLVAPAPSTSSSSAPWSASVLQTTAGSLAQLGLTREGRAHGLAIPGGPADDARPPRHADVSGLGSLLAGHDRELGLGRGGPLLAAIQDVTSASRAPVDGSAVFVVDADAAGAVTSVRAVDVSSDEETWREVAALLLAKMKTRPLRMRPGWHGLTVTLQVRSRLQTAAGSSGRNIPPLGARIALFPLKVLSGSFDVTDLDPKVFRAIEAWEVDERPR